MVCNNDICNENIDARDSVTGASVSTTVSKPASAEEDDEDSDVTSDSGGGSASGSGARMSTTRSQTAGR